MPRDAEVVELAGALDPLLDGLAARVAAGDRVTVVASGDPGFFGIVRLLRERFRGAGLAVHPAPSSVSLAFARIGDHWDDALVVSAHGRPLAAAARAALGHPKVAVLTAPDSPPQAVGRALLDLGSGPRRVAVATRLGEAGEAVTHTDLDGLAAGTFDPMSVVVLRAAGCEGASAPIAGPSLSWGRPESAYEHRAGMITKAETRAVCLAKLALPAEGVLWDVGAGSGSVAIEAAGLAPGLQVIAVEEKPDDAARIAANARTHGVGVEVVTGRAPAAFDGLPDPDRVFVGGGGLEVLDAVLAQLRPDGVVVATYALVDRAAQAWRRLGNLVELSVARGVPVTDLGVRLAAENPVFVAWGPDR